jgi:hypothetical protein
MGDWSTFFNDIGQIAKEFSAAQKAKSHPNDKAESGDSGESFTPHRANQIGENPSCDEAAAAVALVAPFEQSERDSHDVNQQVQYFLFQPCNFLKFEFKAS